MSQTVIECRDMSCYYEKTSPVLSHISFAIRAGESIGLIGANGSGKSTLFGALCGLISHEGVIEIAGLPVEKSRLAQIRSKLGYVMQDSDNQLFMPTVYDDIAFAPRNYGLSPEAADARVNEALNRVGITHLKDRQNYKLSGGEKNLAAIATNRHRLDQNKDFPCAWVAREYPRRRANKEEAYWWPVSKMYDNGIKRIKDSGIHVDGILWYQGESNATTCVAPDTPTDRDYQLETLRALVSELSSLFPVPRSSSAALAKEDSPLPVPRYPFIMMGLPKMNRPWEQYRAVQREVCDETGAIFVDTFAAGRQTRGTRLSR